MDNFITREENDFKNIFNRFKKRDFSGNTGQAIKNSSYQLTTNIVAKIGSLLFTIIIARLLLPELFGLYSLALSTILIFSAIAGLGIGNVLIRFISSEFENKSKIKSYLIYLGKIKIFLILFSSVLLLIFSGYLAKTFYEKPIFLALISGMLYITLLQITEFLQSMLRAANYFKSVFKREIIFQVSRIVLVPLGVFFALKHSLSSESNLAIIILLLSFSLLLASIFLFFDVKKIYSNKFKSLKKNNVINKKEKNLLNNFLLATAVLALSGTFFGNIDRVMLGKFVEGEFIGYYTSAFSLIGALIPLISFSAIALLPIFSKLKGRNLEKGFKKSLNTTLILSLAIFLITFSVSSIAILVIYGKEYLLSANILRVFSVLLIIIPAVSLYQSYYLSQNKHWKLAKLLVMSTVLNIILNYVLITSLLKYSPIAAVYGAAIATIISKFFYFGGLVFERKRYLKHNNT